MSKNTAKFQKIQCVLEMLEKAFRNFAKCSKILQTV